jgi:hypothetical protein
LANTEQAILGVSTGVVKGRGPVAVEFAGGAPRVLGPLLLLDASSIVIANDTAVHRPLRLLSAVDGW